MKALQKTIAPAALAVGLVFGSSVMAQDTSVDTMENTQEMVECTSNATSRLLNDMLDTALENARNDVVLSPDAEILLQQEFEASLETMLLECASDATGIPVNQLPSPNDLEFDMLLEQHIDMDRFELMMENEFMSIMLEAMPKMMELEMLTQ